ncbi:MAG: rhodanese-like domain-containing protein [Bacteroidales bacterium]|nr:rhodanese-like domain-containing protein [Bacteroidales bacterium]MBN2749462.1 rhodanese-like domain-containing protein [Bacteroidales bacterium]
MNITEQPKHQEFQIAGVVHMEPLSAVLALTDHNALLVDVREEEELEVIRIDSTEVVYKPISGIADSFSDLPTDRMLVVVCSNGIRSTKVCNLLMHQGYKNVVNLDGGITQWFRDALPVLMRKHEHNHGHNDGNSCGCCSGGCC